MAKILITIEDLPNGNVKVVAEPSVEIMAAIAAGGDELTPAHGYALHALNEISKRSREMKPQLVVPARASA